MFDGFAAKATSAIASGLRSGVNSANQGRTPMANMLEFLRQGARSIEDHARDYVEKDGGGDTHIRDLTLMGGKPDTPCLLLRTIGRKSGEPRLAALIYGPWKGDFVIIASKGGHDGHPPWYLNIQAARTVDVQVGDKRWRCAWHEPEGAEREEIWRYMAGLYPPYDEYQARTERRIPVVVLTPVEPIAEKFHWRPGDGVDARSRA
jgi:deazaflavin-dependent oxidoreductase (nitroreductase family)